MSEFVWFDLRTADTDGAERFYADLLGWETAREGDMPPMIAGTDGPGR